MSEIFSEFVSDLNNVGLNYIVIEGWKRKLKVRRPNLVVCDKLWLSVRRAPVAFVMRECKRRILINGTAHDPMRIF